MAAQEAGEVDEKAIERLGRPDVLERLHQADDLVAERADEDERLFARTGLGEMQLHLLMDGVDPAPELEVGHVMALGCAWRGTERALPEHYGTMPSGFRGTRAPRAR
jgi:hypothetical protein